MRPESYRLYRSAIEHGVAGRCQVSHQSALLLELRAKGWVRGPRGVGFVVVTLHRRRLSPVDQRIDAGGEDLRCLTRVRFSTVSHQQHFLHVPLGESALPRGELNDRRSMLRARGGGGGEGHAQRRECGERDQDCRDGTASAVGKGLELATGPHATRPPFGCACRPCSGRPCCRSASSDRVSDAL